MPGACVTKRPAVCGSPTLVSKCVITVNQGWQDRSMGVTALTHANLELIQAVGSIKRTPLGQCPALVAHLGTEDGGVQALSSGAAPLHDWAAPESSPCALLRALAAALLGIPGSRSDGHGGAAGCQPADPQRLAWVDAVAGLLVLPGPPPTPLGRQSSHRVWKHCWLRASVCRALWRLACGWLHMSAATERSPGGRHAPPSSKLSTYK